MYRKEREGNHMNADELLKENKAFRVEVAELRQQLEDLRAENACLRKAESDIILEVQGLRRIVFSRIHGDSVEEGGEPVTLPYSVKHRVVICGGHDSWNKAFRPMLKNVRFIERETTINADMIRKADVIWIQTNAFTHAQYMKLMDIARVNGKAVRYFTSASAERCARDVAREDMK